MNLMLDDFQCLFKEMKKKPHLDHASSTLERIFK